MRKSDQTQATIQKYQTDEPDISSANKSPSKSRICGPFLAAHGTGSQYNLLTSQDQRLDLLRTLELRPQQSHRSAAYAWLRNMADRDAFIQQWSTQLSQDLVTARSSLDTAQASLEKAVRHHDLVRLTAAEPSVVLTVAKLSVGSVLKGRRYAFHLDAGERAR